MKTLLDEPFSLKNLNAALQALIVGHDLEMISNRERAHKDVNRAALNSVIAAEIEEPRSLDIIGSSDFFVEEWVEQLFRFGEHRLIPDAG
jgi:hypothetical protein